MVIAAVIANAESEFPPIELAIFLFLTALALTAGGFHMWRNGDHHAAGVWRGRTTAVIPLGVGAGLMGVGVVFGNLVKEEHVVTILLMSCGGLGVVFALLAMIWMPSAMRPGAGGRR